MSNNFYTMKILLLCLFLIPLNIFSQIPNFSSNTSKDDSLHAVILAPEFKQYDFLISYDAVSYWTRLNQQVELLAKKENRWFFIRIQKTYQQDANYQIDDEHPLSVSIKKRRISTWKARKILNIFEENRIFTLDTDSLNIETRKREKSSTDTSKSEHSGRLIITDCTFYTLSFKTKNTFRVVNSYCPYTYLKEIPEITVRQNFINCFETNKILGRTAKFIREFRNKRSEK